MTYENNNKTNCDECQHLLLEISDLEGKLKSMEVEKEKMENDLNAAIDAYDCDVAKKDEEISALQAENSRMRGALEYLDTMLSEIASYTPSALGSGNLVTLQTMVTKALSPAAKPEGTIRKNLTVGKPADGGRNENHPEVA